MSKTRLPPGQREREDFPRFGLTQFAERFPSVTDRIQLRVGGDVRSPLTLEHEWAGLPRTEMRADFHCVTTWTRRSLLWGGVRFSDFYHQLVLPRVGPEADAVFVVLRAQDGYRTSLPLADMLAESVLLADHLDGQPLPVAHGAPLRLVAPAHYGYKSIKHLDRIEFRCTRADDRPIGPRFMAHDRARVAFEERGQGVPGWLLRWLYRPLIRPTAARFARALNEQRP